LTLPGISNPTDEVLHHEYFDNKGLGTKKAVDRLLKHDTNVASWLTIIAASFVMLYDVFV